MIALSISVYSQTQVWEKKFNSTAAPQNVTLMQITDIDAVKDDGYASAVTKNGSIGADSTLKVWDFISGEIEYSGKIPKIPASEMSSTLKSLYIYAYKNLYASNNTWSIAAYHYNSLNSGIFEIYTNGSKIFSLNTTNIPYFYKFGQDLYMSATTASDSITRLYLVRSNLVSSINEIKDIKNALHMTLADNLESITIKVSGAERERYTWKAYRIDGAVLESGIMERVNTQYIAKINKAGMNNGKYIIVANSGKEIASSSFNVIK